jgi:hypothetical protein
VSSDYVARYEEIENGAVLENDHVSVYTEEREVEAAESGVRRSTREHRTIEPMQVNPKQKSYFTLSPNQSTPSTIEQALASPEKVKWREAIDAELESIQLNQVWELVPRRNQRVIGTRWLFKVKHDVNNQPIRYKARLVAKGYNQRFGIDYHETFSPVVKYQSLRVLLAIAASLNLHVHQIDVDTAFLNGELSDLVHVEPPPGSNISSEFVCKLKKTLYGLKQSPHEWNQTLIKFLVTMGFKQVMSDVCVLVKGTIFLAIYVDDILIIGESLKVIQYVKEAIAEKFDIKDLGEARLLVGINLEKWDDGSWHLDQQHYINEIMELYCVNNLKTTEIPMQPNLGLTSDLESESEALRSPVDRAIYQQVIGKLMYLMVCTRPDISFTVSVLSRFVTQPKEKHWRCVIQLLKYINSTKQLSLCYPSQGQVVLSGYSDSDHAGDHQDRKSTSGYVFMVGNCCVSWRSVKQTTVSISSTEAEYIALSTCAQEALWLRLLLKELGYSQRTTSIYNDNLSSHQIAKGSTSARSKHIDVRHHFIRDHINKKELEILYMSTNDLPADAFTKAVNKDKLDACRNNINLIY